MKIALEAVSFNKAVALDGGSETFISLKGHHASPEEMWWDTDTSILWYRGKKGNLRFTPGSNVIYAEPINGDVTVDGKVMTPRGAKTRVQEM